MKQYLLSDQCDKIRPINNTINSCPGTQLQDNTITILEILELYNSQKEIRSSPCEQTFKEQRRTPKKNHLGKSSMNNHVSPNRYHVLADVAGNNNNVDVTIDKETMNEQELDRLYKKTNCETDKRKVSNLKKIVILGDSIVKHVNGGNCRNH